MISACVSVAVQIATAWMSGAASNCAIVSRGQGDVELAGDFLGGGEVDIGHAGQSRTADARGEILRVDFADSAGANDSEIDGF